MPADPPEPQPDETESQWMIRCLAILINDGQAEGVATQNCQVIWRAPEPISE